MNQHLHIADARRKNIRWRILAVCDSSRDIRLSEQIVLQVLSEPDLNVSPAELRKEASFLAKKGLIQIDTDKGEQLFSITAYGVEYVEYDVADIKSIGRPPKYF